MARKRGGKNNAISMVHTQKIYSCRGNVPKSSNGCKAEPFFDSRKECSKPVKKKN